jgi:hypothetical protein
MTILLLHLYALQAPITWDEVAKAKHAAYRALEDYYETWSVRILDEEGEDSFFLDRYLAKEKYRISLRKGTTFLLESGYDGQRRWIVSHERRAYAVLQGPNPAYSDPWKPVDAKAIPANSFHFNFLDGYDLTFQSNPPLKVIEDQKEEGYRRIRSKAVRTDTGATVTVTEWFHADSWLLAKFDVDIVDGERTLSHIEGRVVNSSKQASNPAKRFEMPSTVAESYREVPWSQIGGPG